MRKGPLGLQPIQAAKPHGWHVAFNCNVSTYWSSVYALWQGKRECRSAAGFVLTRFSRHDFQLSNGSQ